MIDVNRLASVIFDSGRKITQSEYTNICSLIESDCFTTNQLVIRYKLKESFLEKISFRLDDKNVVLVSEDFLSKINQLNIDKHQLEEYMRCNYKNFKSVSDKVYGNY